MSPKARGLIQRIDGVYRNTGVTIIKEVIHHPYRWLMVTLTIITTLGGISTTALINTPTTSAKERLLQPAPNLHLNGYSTANATGSYSAIEAEQPITFQVPPTPSGQSPVLTYMKNGLAIEPGKQGIEVSKKSVEAGEEITIMSADNSAPVGIYSIAAVDPRDNKAFYQDYKAWGVLAFNTDYSTYPGGQIANISLAVLDDNGRMICDAALLLEITNPRGQVTLIGTGDGSIKVNLEECRTYAVTTKPDYETTYLPTIEGEYKVKLTSKTKYGERVLEDSFSVKNNEPYYLQRIGATRIYPVDTYENTINFNPKESGQYTIHEYIPSTFTASHPDDTNEPNYSEIVTGDQKQLTWEVSAEKNAPISLRYKFKAPELSPYIFKIGPAEAINSQGTTKREGRSWLIASDEPGSANSSRLRSVGFELQSTTAAMEYLANTGSPAITTTSGQFRSGAAALDVTTTSGVAEGMELDFATANTADGYYFRAYVKLNTIPNANTSLIEAYDSGNTVQTSIQIKSDGTLLLCNIEDDASCSSPVLTYSTALTTGVWYMLELKEDSTTIGSTKVNAKVDGVSFGADGTVNHANGIMTYRVGFLSTSHTNSPSMYIDDLAVNNDSSTDVTNGNWAGEGKIVHLRPNADANTETWVTGAGTNCSATNCYTLVDEITPDDGASNDFIKSPATCSSTSNQYFDLDNSSTAGIGANDSIRLIQANARLDRASNQAQSALNLGLTDSVGSGAVSATFGTLANGTYNTNDNSASTANPIISEYDRFGTASDTVYPLTPAYIDGVQIRVFPNGTDCAPVHNVATLWATVEYATATGGRLYSSGFELQSTTAGVEWTTVANTPTIDTTTKRTGAASLRANGWTTSTQENLGYTFASANTDGTFYARFYFYIATAPAASTENRVMSFRDSGNTDRAYITLTDTRTLKLYDEDGQIGSASSALSTSTWYRIEIQFNRNAGTNGTVEAKIDGATAFATSSTRAISTGVTQLVLGGNLGAAAITAGDWYFDDVALNQNIGTSQASYPGVGGIIHLKPNADGDTVTWTNTYTNIDEVTPNDATDAVTSTTLNQIEEANIEDATSNGIASTDVISLVSVGVRFNSTSTQISGFKVRVKDAANATSIESNQILANSTTWKTNTDTGPIAYPITAYTRPNQGSSWTPTVLDSSQIGIRETTDTTDTQQISTLWMLVEYYQPPITVSGGCFTDETEGTACTDDGSNEVKVAVNGNVQTNSDTVVDGSWSFTIDKPSSGDVLVFFVNGEVTESEEVTTVTKYDGSGDVDLVKMYQSQLVFGTDTGSANSGQTITAADLDTTTNGYENSDDEDVLYDITVGADLTVDAEATHSEQLYIINGNTYRPASGGGSDTSTLNLTIDTSATITADSNAFSINGNWTNNGTFTSGTSTVTFTSTATGKTLSGTLSGSTGKFYNLVFNGVSGAWSFSAAVETANDFQVSNGGVDTNNNNLTVTRDFLLDNTTGVSFTAGSSTITVSRDWSKGLNATFTRNSSTVQLNGTGQILAPGGGQTQFENLTAAYNTKTTTMATARTDVFGVLTLGDASGGTMTCSTTCEFELFRTAGADLVLGSAATLSGSNATFQLRKQSASTVTVTAGTNYGTWNILMNSDVAGLVTFNQGGNITTSGYMQVKANASGTATFNTQNYTINADKWVQGDSTSSGATASNWGSSTATFSRPSATDTFYVNSNGGSHTADFSTAHISATGNVRFVNGTGTLAVTPGTSQFTFAPPSATTTTYAPNGQSLYDVVVNGSGGTIQPNAAVDANHDFTITAGTYDTVSGSNYALTIGGSYSNSGTFTAQQGTVTFDAGVTGKTMAGTMTGGSAFYNLIFSGSGGDWTPSAAVTISNDLTMTNGSLLGTQNITVNGNVAGTSGIINLSGGLFKQRPIVSKNFGTTSGSTAWTFNDLTFSFNDPPVCPSNYTITTQAGTGGITVAGILKLGEVGDCPSTWLDAGSRTWTLSGTGGDPFQLITGDLVPNSSTFVYTGNNGGGNTTVQSETYNNFTVNNGSETYALEGTTQGVAVTITAGTLSLNSQTLTATGDLTVDGTLSGSTNVTVNGHVQGTGTINLTGGTFEHQMTQSGGSKNFGTTSGSNAWTFNDLTFSNAGPICAGRTATTQSASGGITVSGILRVGKSGDSTGCTTILNAGNRTWTLSGTGGDPFQLLASPAGDLSPSTSTFTFTGNNGAGNTKIQVETYNNLTVNNASETYYLEGNTTVGGDLTITTGTLDVSDGVSTYSLTITGSYSNSGDFNSRTGTVTFNSTTSGKTLAGQMTGSSDDFYNLIFDGVSGAWSFSAAVDVANDFTVNNGAVTASNNNLTVTRDYTLANTSGVGYTAGSSTVAVARNYTDLGGKYTIDTSKVDMTGTGAIDISTGFEFYNLDVAHSSFTTTFPTSKTINISNIVTFNGGTLTGSSSTLTPRPRANGKPLVFNSATTLNGSGFNIISFTGYNASTTVTVDGDNYGSWNLFFAGSTNNTTYNLDAAITNTGEMRVYSGASTGTIFNTANYALTSTSFRLGSGGATQTVSANFGSSAVTFTGTSNTLHAESTGGTYNLDLGSSTVDTKGNILFLNSTGAITVTPGTSLVKWTHTSGTKTYASNGQSLYNMELNCSGGTVQPTAAVDVDHDFTVTAGTYDTVSGSNYALTVGHDFSNSGTFTAQNATVTLDGSTKQTLSGTLTGSSAFYNLTVTNSSGADASDCERTGFTPSIDFNVAITATNNLTWTTASTRFEFNDGSTYTFNNINWNGQATGTRIYFRNSVAGSGSWLLKVTGTQTAVSYINVSRSDASVAGGSTINASDGTNVDCTVNTNWNFGAPTFDQSAYRFANNQNNTDVNYTGSPAQDTALTVASTGQQFRLRMLLHVGSSNLAINGQNFKLQYGERTAANCTTGVSWGDVTTGSGVIRYYDNATPVDEDNLTNNAGDPTHSGHTINNQDYEEANNFTNSVSAINTGEDGKWDFSLENNSAVGGKIYCFRATKSDGTAIDSYTVYPQVVIDEELVFSLDATSKNFGVIQPGANPTSQTSTLTVSTNSSTGYVIYGWATQAMTRDAYTIPDWGGTNGTPTTWPNGSFGFGYTTDDASLTGGTADRFTNGGAKYAGFGHSGPGDPVADRTSGPASSQQNIVTYQVAGSGSQQSGTYTTVIVYVASATF